MQLAVSNTGISDLVSLDGQRPLGYAHHPSGESASDQLGGSTPGTLYDRICVWDEIFALDSCPTLLLILWMASFWHSSPSLCQSEWPQRGAKSVSITF